jgi:hypothetical protein
MKSILTLLFLLPAFISYSQSDADMPVKQNRIAVTTGLNQFKDENIHPKVFRGITIGSSYLHSRISKNILEYGAGFKITLMNTSYEDFPSSVNILILANYKYLFSIVSSQSLHYYLGPLADMQYGTSAYFNWDESHFYFANYLSGGISNRITYKAGNKTFDFNLDVPLLSCICRPELNRQYKIDDMTFTGIFTNLASNPEVVFPDKNFYVKAGIEMNYQSGRKKLRSIGYNFMYHNMKAANGLPYQNIENTISYKFIF